MKRINIIAWHNGGGLSRDVDILAGAIPTGQYEVYLNGAPLPEAPVRSRRIYHRLHNQYRLLFQRRQLSAEIFDLNLFLEDITPGFFPYARANAFIPNPEWFKPGQRPLLSQLDAVLCKTREAIATFDSMGAKTRFISFTSDDRQNPGSTPAKDTGFLHVAGRSWQKGTAALIEVWLKHPEWPVLRVVQSAKTYSQARVNPVNAPNIIHILERLGDADLRSLQNSHAVHLCPSEAEGFGHCIAEAMSCGALTLTTNAPPMNELVSPERGVLVDYSRSEPQRSGYNYFVDHHALEVAIEEIIAMDAGSAETLGQRARQWYEENDRTFRDQLAAALKALSSDSDNEPY